MAPRFESEGDEEALSQTFHDNSCDSDPEVFLKISYMLQLG